MVLGYANQTNASSHIHAHQHTYTRTSTHTHTHTRWRAHTHTRARTHHTPIHTQPATTRTQITTTAQVQRFFFLRAIHKRAIACSQLFFLRMGLSCCCFGTDFPAGLLFKNCFLRWQCGMAIALLRPLPLLLRRLPLLESGIITSSFESQAAALHQ